MRRRRESRMHSKVLDLQTWFQKNYFGPSNYAGKITKNSRKIVDDFFTENPNPTYEAICMAIDAQRIAKFQFLIELDKQITMLQDQISEVKKQINENSAQIDIISQYRFLNRLVMMCVKVFEKKTLTEMTPTLEVLISNILAEKLDGYISFTQAA